MKAVVASARQNKRKRAEFEAVLSGPVHMKLELARSKVALDEQVAQREDAERLLRESIDANLEKTAQIKENMTSLQAVKRMARWKNADMQVLQRKYNTQLTELADLKSRLLEQHDKDSYTFDTRKGGQVNRRAKEARTECKKAKTALQRQDKQIEALLRKASSAEAKLLESEVDINKLNDQINFYSTVFKCLELWSTEDGANQLFTLPGTILGLIYQTPVEDPYMKRIVEPHETDAEVRKILIGTCTTGSVVWAAHASGHIDPETKNDKIVSSGMTKRSCEEKAKGTGKSNNDDCERIIANMRYLGVQARNLRVEGKNALVMSKINNPLAFLKEGKLGVHSKLFAYIRRKARQDLKKAGTKKDVWRRIAEDKVKYSEPAPCTELQAKRKATREQAIAMHQATAADYIQQLVDPYLDAEGDIAKKSVKELDAMIAAWKLVPKIVNHQGRVWPGATFPKDGTGKPDKNGKCGIKKKGKVDNILSVLHSYLDATKPRAT